MFKSRVARRKEWRKQRRELRRAAWEKLNET